MVDLRFSSHSNTKTHIHPHNLSSFYIWKETFGPLIRAAASTRTGSGSGTSNPHFCFLSVSIVWFTSQCCSVVYVVNSIHPPIHSSNHPSIVCSTGTCGGLSSELLPISKGASCPPMKEVHFRFLGSGSGSVTKGEER